MLVSSPSSLLHNTHSAEAKFLDGIKSFPPCYSQSPLQMDFTPPPPDKSGLKLVCNVNSVYGNLSLRTFDITPRNLNEIVRQ
jgi:hypothetical protein